MPEIFPEPISDLPEADVPLKGVRAYLSQGEGHQIVFMEFSADVDLPEHSHAAQAGFIIEGRMDLTIGGKKHTLKKGDRYHIPAGVKHSGRIYAGYADITFFSEAHRYRAKARA